MIRKAILCGAMNHKNSIIKPAVPGRVLSLESLRSYVAIHETGSFRRAAERVSLSPSAVSLQIGKLEELLGHRLLERNARRVVLTQAGEVLLRQARNLLAINDETLGLFCDSALEGRLILGAPHDLGMHFVPELLRQMAERYPCIRIDVQLGASSDALADFKNGRSNAVLFNDVGTPAVPSRDVWSEPLVWVMARGGRVVCHDPLPLAIASASCTWRGAALDALDACGRPYRIAYSSDAPAGQVAAVSADLAIAALPASMANSHLLPVPADMGLPQLPHTHVRLAHDDGPVACALADLAEEVARKQQRHERS